MRRFDFVTFDNSTDDDLFFSQLCKPCIGHCKKWKNGGRQEREREAVGEWKEDNDECGGVLKQKSKEKGKMQQGIKDASNKTEALKKKSNESQNVASSSAEEEEEEYEDELEEEETWSSEESEQARAGGGLRDQKHQTCAYGVNHPVKKDIDAKHNVETLQICAKNWSILSSPGGERGVGFLRGQGQISWMM